MRATPTVGPGTAVRVREERSGEERWWIIEDSPDPQRRRDELPPDDPLALALHGKAVDEQVTLPGRPLYPRTVTIREIVPKAVYRWRWCGEHLADLFPDQASIEAVPIRVGPDDAIDLGPVEDHAEQRAAELRRVEALYTQGPLSLHTFAAHFGESVIDTVAHLAARPDLPLRCTRGTDRSELVATREAARTAEALVLDASALGTLLVLGEVDLLHKLPIPVIVAAGTLQLVRDLVRDAPDLERTVAPAVAMRRLTRLRHLRDTLETVCQVEPGMALAALPPEQRERLVQFCGQDGAEAVVLGSGPGRVLWTDDYVVAYLASHELGARSTPTQPVLVRWRDAGILAGARGAKAMVRLVAMGYTGTILLPGDILVVLEDEGWRADAPLADAALAWLTRAPLTHDGLVRFVLSVFKPLWQRVPLPSLARSVTWQLLDRLGARGDAEAVIRAVFGAIDPVFGLDVVRAAHVREVITTWIGFRWPYAEEAESGHDKITE